MPDMFKKKMRAAAIHLLCSAILVLLVGAAIYTVWYPDYLIFITDADKILALILIVDICIGPFLTFIVFNDKKKELKRDLRIIIAIQLSALIYGIYTIGIARPAYVVFAVDRFEIAYMPQLTQTELDKTTSNTFNKKPAFWQKPTWISAKLPSDIEERNQILFNSVGGRDLAQTPRYFRPLENDRLLIKEKAQDLNQEQKNKFKENFKNTVITTNYKVLPMAGKTRDFSIVIDTSNLEIVTILDVSPWED